MGKCLEGFKRNISGLSAWLFLSWVIIFMLCIFEPLNMYFVNMDQYEFDFYKLLPICLVMALLFFFIAVLYGTLILVTPISDKLLHISCTAGSILFLALYIQGNFFAGSLPVLDGSVINWNDYSLEKIQSAVIWIAVASIIIFFAVRLKRDLFFKGVRYASMGIFGVLLLTMITVGLQNGGFKHRSLHAITTEGEWEYSTDRNVIILVLDAVDEGVEMSVLKDNPEYQAAYSDFTFYENVVGSYPFTKYALPFFMSGEWFELDEDYEDYSVRALTESGLISRLREEDYNLGIYTDEISRHSDDMLIYSNIRQDPCKIISYVRFCKALLKFVCFKYLPYGLKDRLNIWYSELNELIDAGEYEKIRFLRSNKRFFEALNERGITYTESKSFKLIHIEGGHVPFIYTKDMEVVEKTDYYTCVEAANTIAVKYLDRLKESGVYDNSVIIIISDHGLNRVNDKNPMDRHHPILMVKGIGEHGNGMKYLDYPISQEDYVTAFVRLADGKGASEMFEGNETEERDRRYIYTETEEDKNFIEYILPKGAFAGDELVQTGIKYD